jgi:Uma2 family endonuclease
MTMLYQEPPVNWRPLPRPWIPVTRSLKARTLAEIQPIDHSPFASLAEEKLYFEQVITEDEEPVDNLFAAKQQRLLVESLYHSWQRPPGTFLADANVGVFPAPYQSPLVPDVFVSTDVPLPPNLQNKQDRSYFVWKMGKPPDVVIEIVSNRKGGEADDKLQDYAHLGVPYYIILDPFLRLSKRRLRVYELRDDHYVRQQEKWLASLELGVGLWRGTFEDLKDVWLRWYDADGQLFLTGGERAKQEGHRADRECQRAEQEQREKLQAFVLLEQEQQRAEQERQRAEQERQRAEQERQRAEQLAAKLRELGIEPLI